MATNIKQVRDDKQGVTTLSVAGEMFFDDAVLIEKIAACARDESGDRIVIDLADLDLLDSEAASILRRIAARDGFEIDGTEIFLQSLVDDAERYGR
jgi:anti-anti-sigma regulatory factor